MALELKRSRTEAQYIATTNALAYPTTFGARYIFGELEQRELAVETRLDVVLSPTVSLQLFAQPLLSSGAYLSYKQLTTPESFDFDVFEEGLHEVVGQTDVCRNARTCVDASRRRYIDFDGDGSVDYALNDQDFNVRSLVGNIVFRWKYRPGSTLFFVWQRTQEDEVGRGDFAFGRDLRALVRAPAENAFMVKLNYWFALR